jgi:hypothetical protein
MNYPNYPIAPIKGDLVYFSKKLFMVEAASGKANVVIQSKGQAQIVSLEKVTLISGGFRKNNGKVPDLLPDSYLMALQRMPEMGAIVGVGVIFSALTAQQWHDLEITGFHPMDKTVYDSVTDEELKNFEH